MTTWPWSDLPLTLGPGLGPGPELDNWTAQIQKVYSFVSSSIIYNKWTDKVCFQFRTRQTKSAKKLAISSLSQAYTELICQLQTVFLSYSSPFKSSRSACIYIWKYLELDVLSEIDYFVSARYLPLQQSSFMTVGYWDGYMVDGLVLGWYWDGISFHLSA